MQIAGSDVREAVFGGEAPAAVRRLLEEASAAYANTNRAEAILWTAQAMDPQCLPVYFSLYKFYFYKGRLEDAERVTRQGMLEAAGQANIGSDWTRLTAHSADWADAMGPQHFYLFSLKALAFICLRQHKLDEAQALLGKLQEIDPQDRVGASVIRDFAAGALS